MKSKIKTKTDHITTRIWKSTLRNLRFVKAYTNESGVEILDRLVKQELEKVSNDKNISI